jgi:hypothetical protein
MLVAQLHRRNDERCSMKKQKHLPCQPEFSSNVLELLETKATDGTGREDYRGRLSGDWLAFGQSTATLTGTADSWYAPRKNRNAMPQGCSFRNLTNNLAQTVDFQ